MAVVDLDEFIVLHEKDNLRDFMAEYADCSQISLHWVIYGSSGHEKRPDGLVLENFKGHSAVPDFSPKSILIHGRLLTAERIICGSAVNG